MTLFWDEAADSALRVGGRAFRQRLQCTYLPLEED